MGPFQGGLCGLNPHPAQAHRQPRTCPGMTVRRSASLAPCNSQPPSQLKPAPQRPAPSPTPSGQRTPEGWAGERTGICCGPTVRSPPSTLTQLNLKTPPLPDGDDESLQQLTEATQHTMGVLRGGAPNPKLAFSSTTSHRGTPHPGLFEGTNPKSNQQATSKSVEVDKSH